MANRDQDLGVGRQGSDPQNRADPDRDAGSPTEPRAFDVGRDSTPQGEDSVGYAGQEYGMESGADRPHTTSEDDPSWRGDEREISPTAEREAWSPGKGEPYGELELNPKSSGVEAFGAPHDYAYHPPAKEDDAPDADD